MNSKYHHSFAIHGPEYLDEYGALGPFGQGGFECCGRMLNRDVQKTSRKLTSESFISFFVDLGAALLISILMFFTQIVEERSAQKPNVSSALCLIWSRLLPELIN